MPSQAAAAAAALENSTPAAVRCAAYMSSSRSFKAFFSLGRDSEASASNSPAAAPSSSSSSAAASPARPKKSSAWNAVKTVLKITKNEDVPKDDGKTVFQVGDCTFETPEAYARPCCTATNPNPHLTSVLPSPLTVFSRCERRYMQVPPGEAGLLPHVTF